MDKILINGKILTMMKEKEFVQGIAIKDGKIVELGQNEDVLALKDPATEVIDLKGKLALPGFIDSHMHLIGYADSLQKVNLKDVKSIEELILKTKMFIEDKKIPKGQWVLGYKWNEENFTGRKTLNKHDLDRISKDHPISLTRCCHHVYAVNSKTLEIIGINKDIPSVDGGKIVVDSNGEATGLLLEQAVRIVQNAIDEKDVNQLKKDIIEAVDKAVAQGITSICTDDFICIPSNDYEKVTQVYKELIEEGNLKIRINEQCRISKKHILDQFIEQQYHHKKIGEFFTMGPLKILLDGTLGARTAYVYPSYEDDKDNYGIVLYNEQELDNLVITAHKAGMQVAIHCIGNKAIEMALNSIEKAQHLYSRKDCRHQIIHAQLTTEALMERFADLKVIANTQPIFLNNDLHIVEERVGKDRAKWTYNWNTMRKKGINLAFGSDCPIEPLDVLPNLYCAINRQDLEGYPKGGWLPKEKLAVYEAIDGFTRGAAYGTFEENIKGAIRKGMYGDIVVLQEDIFSIPCELIKDVKVYMTIVNGEVVYREED